MGNLIELIKQIAINAIENTKPVNIFYGEVTSADPLVIKVEQKNYTKEFLVLTRNVTDYSTYIQRDEAGQKEKYKIYNSLEKGDIVILQRMQGGQEFIVLDRRG